MHKIASPKELAYRLQAILEYCASAEPRRSRIASELHRLAEDLGGDNDDVWLDREAVAQICPSCAAKMASLGIRKIRASVIFSSESLMSSTLKTAAWEGLPKGWTEESLKKFWGSLTGDVKHKVTKCIKKMETVSGVDDPGAFCASLRDKLEGKEWRSEER